MPSRRLSVRTKLLASFGILIVIAVALVAIAIRGMSSVDRTATAVGTNVVPSIVLNNEMNTAAGALRSAQLGHVATSSNSEMDAAERSIQAAGATMRKALADYRPLIVDDVDRGHFDAVSREWAAYVKATAAVPRLSRGDDAANARALELLNGANRTTYGKVTTEVQGWTKFNEELARKELSDGHQAFASARGLLIALTIAAVLISVGLALLISRSITRSVAVILDRLRMLTDHCTTELRAALDKMADGDLTVEVVPVTPRIESWTNDELGDVAQAVNAVRDNTVASVESYNASRASLAAIVGRVTSSASILSSASQQMASTSEEAGRAIGEIASAVSDVAEGSERQVGSVDTARRMTEDVVNATTHTATNATETAHAAEDARKVAAEGARAVGQATEAMAAVRDASDQATSAIRDLGAKSDQIGGIVGTITGIAEQTNLLALNAAIEAARAGDQGRGFAVVADEVRKLAEESQQAAATISALIGEIQAETGRAVEVVELGGQRTSEGAATVEQAREAFERIGGSVEDVTGRANDIAAAIQQISASAQSMSEEMSTVAAVAEESSASTEQVSASTEQISASTQQIAASAQELAQTAEELDQLVRHFQLA